MLKSTTPLASLLASLTLAARARGLNDSKWASAAGLSKETLSRLRRRQTCDLSTLVVLAEAAGAAISVSPVAKTPLTADGHFPSELTREYEASLVSLCASKTLDLAAWRNAGPAFFMGGLAVLVASDPEADRTGFLKLAEALHPGVTEVSVFGQWLKRSPVRPSRFFPMLAMENKHAA
jgi:DNA-binding phage protein